MHTPPDQQTRTDSITHVLTRGPGPAQALRCVTVSTQHGHLGQTISSQRSLTGTVQRLRPAENKSYGDLFMSNESQRKNSVQFNSKLATSVKPSAAKTPSQEECSGLELWRAVSVKLKSEREAGIMVNSCIENSQGDFHRSCCLLK